MKFKELITVIFFQLILLSSAFPQYNFNTFLTRAKKDIADSNYTEAINKLNICIQVQPNENEAYFYRGLCRFYLYDDIGAEEDFTKALSAFSPVYYDAYHDRSIVRYRTGNFKGAIEDINKLIAKQPENPKFYIERAFDLLANNNFNAALEDCKTALKLKWLGDDVYLCKAAAEDALGDYDDALCDYDMAITINPKNADLYVRRGMTKHKLENYKEAIDDYNRAVKIDSTCTFAYFNRAEAEIKLDDNKKAMSDYNMVLLYEPRNAYAWFNRALLFANLKKYKNGIEDFDKVLLLNPDNIQALFNRAKLKQNINDLTGALNDYGKVIELYPYFTEAYYNRAQIKYELRDAGGAQKDIEAGRVMREVFNSKNNTQLRRDSALLSNLITLNAGFNNISSAKDDTVSVGILPLFYITDKDLNPDNNSAYFPLLEKINKKTGKSFYFTNKQSTPVFNPENGKSPGIDSLVANSQNIDELLSTAILKSNLLLLNDARKYYDKIISCDNNNALAYFARGVNTCLEIDMIINNNEPYILTNSSHTVVKNEKNQKCQSALADFTKALQLQPSFYFACYNRANVKCMLQDFYGALKDYETSVKLNPDFGQAYYNQGFLLYYLDNKKQACADFSKAGQLGVPESYNMMKRYCSK